MEIVPALIDRLTDEQEFIGAKAVDKLRRLCRQNFNWQAGSSAMAKARAATAWHKWYLQFRAGEVTIDINLIIGSVSQVQIDQNLVMINVGRRSDVRLGDDFEVVRDDAVIARLRVHSVGEQFSFARQYMADMEHSVREGDVVRKKRGS